MAIENIGLYPITIDVYKKHKESTVYANDNDMNGRGLLISLVKNNAAFDSTGISLKIGFRNAVGEERLYDCELVDALTGQYKVFYPTEMLVGNGGRVVKLEIKAYEVSGALLNYAPMFVYVNASEIPDDAISGTNEASYLKQLTDEVLYVQDQLLNITPEQIEHVSTSESARVLAEGTRVGNESTRISAESLRANAETNRNTSYNVAEANRDGLYEVAEANRSTLVNSINAQLGEIDQRVDTIITTHVPVGEVIAQEIIDARQGAGSVGANLTEVKSNITKIESENSARGLLKFADMLNNGEVENIKLIGDSITAGVGAIGGGADPEGRIILTMTDLTEIREGYQTSACWANFFRNYISAKHPAITFLNNGIGGWSVKIEGTEYKDVWVGTNNDVVFVMIGSNDRGDCATELEFEQYLAPFLAHVKANSKHMIVMTASPTLNDFDSAGVQTPSLNLTMEQIDKVITKVCIDNSYPHISLYREVLKYSAETQLPLKILLQTTGSHPIDAGYLLMWNIIQQKLGFIRNTYEWDLNKIDTEKMRIINNSGEFITNATPISYFDDRSITYSLITSAHPDIVNFPENTSGLLITIKGYSPSYSYQEYHITGSNIVYHRAVYGETWRAWESYREVYRKDGGLINNSSQITDYYKGITYCNITSGHPDIANFPKSLPGMLMTYRLGDDTYSYQQYRIRGAGITEVYERMVYGTGWRAWKRISGNLYMTTAIRNALLSIGLTIGDMVFDTTLNKPIWRNAGNNGWVDAMGTEV